MLIQYLILIGVVILVIGFYLQIGKIRDKLSILEARNLDQVFAMLQQNLQGVHERLDNNSKSMNERLDRASTVIGALNKELGSIQTIGQSIKSFQDFQVHRKGEGISANKCCMSR